MLWFDTIIRLSTFSKFIDLIWHCLFGRWCIHYYCNFLLFYFFFHWWKYLFWVAFILKIGLFRSLIIYVLKYYRNRSIWDEIFFKSIRIADDKWRSNQYNENLHTHKKKRNSTLTFEKCMFRYWFSKKNPEFAFWFLSFCSLFLNHLKYAYKIDILICQQEFQCTKDMHLFNSQIHLMPVMLAMVKMVERFSVKCWVSISFISHITYESLRINMKHWIYLQNMKNTVHFKIICK